MMNEKKKGAPSGTPIPQQDYGTTTGSRNQMLAEVMFDLIGKFDKPIRRPANPSADRAFRRLIEEANRNGDCIINLGDGYFRPGPDDNAALGMYLLKEHARAREILTKCVAMRQAYNQKYHPTWE